VDERRCGHRKLVASRSADELSGVGGSGRKSAVDRAKVAAVECSKQRSGLSRFSYIYGSVDDDDDDAGSSVATLDRFIPVYEEFKSATAARPTSTASQRHSHHYITMDELSDSPQQKTAASYDVARGDTSVVYDVAAPLPEDDGKSAEAAAAAAAQQSDPELDADQPASNATDSFPCPVCEEPVSVSLDEHDGSTCGFVEAMQELIASQAVDARRTCGNCTTPTAADPQGRQRPPASWRCLDCRHDLCGPCHDAHLSLRLRHRVVSIADLQTGRHQGELSAALASPCSRHRDRDCTCLCLDCGVVACAECLKDGEPHGGHRVTQQLREVADRQRDYICTLLDDTSRRLNQLNDNARLIADYRKQFEADRDDVIRAINLQVYYTPAPNRRGIKRCFCLTSV